jgi:hypothetical protein
MPAARSNSPGVSPGFLQDIGTTNRIATCPALFAAGLLLRSVCSFASGAALSGRVVDETATVRTPAHGWYSFWELPDDEYSVTASLQGFRSESESVCIVFPSKVVQDFTRKITEIGGDEVHPDVVPDSYLIGRLIHKDRRETGLHHDEPARHIHPGGRARTLHPHRGDWRQAEKQALDRPQHCRRVSEPSQAGPLSGLRYLASTS